MQYNHFKILIGVFILLILIIVLIIVAVNNNNGGNCDDSSDDCSNDDFSHSIGPVSSFDTESKNECEKSHSVEFTEKTKKPFKNYKK
jgi:hypothetical protein